MTLRLAAHTEDSLGEGPLWDPRTHQLYWFDIFGQRIHALAKDGRVSSWAVPVRASAGAIWGADALLVAGDNALHRFHPGSGEFAKVLSLPSDSAHRCNDGKCDPHGSFWISTMRDEAAAEVGRIYRVSAAGSIEMILEGIGVPNGLAWSPDAATLYWADSASGSIHATRFPAEACADTRMFARVSGAAPDGAATDAEGYLWSAHWDGWRVVRYASDGRIDRIVDLPIQRPTCCAFGGPDLRTLYVTSARYGLDASSVAGATQDGGLFALDVEVPGMAIPPFAGSTDLRGPL